MANGKWLMANGKWQRLRRGVFANAAKLDLFAACFESQGRHHQTNYGARSVAAFISSSSSRNERFHQPWPLPGPYTILTSGGGLAPARNSSNRWTALFRKY